MKKVVLAYSGGLDTSVCVKWLKEKYNVEVVTATVDVGNLAPQDYEPLRNKALQIGASEAFVIDARDEFVADYIAYNIKANALYEGEYNLATALSRPLIVEKLIEITEKVQAQAVAFGSTGKGNDQVRFEVGTKTLRPELEIIAPVREWSMSREDEINYARDRGIPIPVDIHSPYSIDANLWGRSIECGVLEDPWQEPPEDIFSWTTAPQMAPDEPEYVEVEFTAGLPVAINGEKLECEELITELNTMAGNHSLGRIDHVENRLVGIKSREIYESPAAALLLLAHKQLEDLTLPRELAHFKPTIEKKYSEALYNGLWFTPLMDSLQAFLDASQQTVSGTVRVKMYKGHATVVGRKSPFSLYDYGLATYDENDDFDHNSASGFIDIWSLPSQVYAAVRKKNEAAESRAAQASEAGEQE